MKTLYDTDPPSTARHWLAKEIVNMYRLELKLALSVQAGITEDKKPAAKTDMSQGPPEPKQDVTRTKTLEAFPIVPMFSAQQETTTIQQRGEDIPLRVSQIMPHARVQVGKNGKSTLEAMVDTGAGLNLGRLYYHENIFKTHPDIVHKFQWIKDMQAHIRSTVRR